MSVYRDKQRNTWFVVTRYKDWTGKAKQTTKRGLEQNMMLKDMNPYSLTKRKIALTSYLRTLLKSI